MREGRLAGSPQRYVCGGLGTGGVGRPGEPERQEERRESQVLAVVQPDGRGYAAIADERPVLAAEIIDPGVVVQVDTGVATRHGRRRQFDDVGVAAPKHVLTVEDGQDRPRSAIRARDGERRRSAGSVNGNERVAKPVHGADKARMARVVTQPAPDLGDEAVQGDVGDERVGPQMRVDLLLRHRLGPPLDEQREQVERLLRQLELRPPRATRASWRHSKSIDLVNVEGIEETVLSINERR